MKSKHVSKSLADDAIGFALVDQVLKAVNFQGNESNVRTIITRPMWNAWLRFINKPEDSKPTEWLGLLHTIRVYGSETIVIESKEMFSVSFKKERKI